MTIGTDQDLAHFLHVLDVPGIAAMPMKVLSECFIDG